MEEMRNGRNVVLRRIKMMKKEASDLAGNGIEDENGKVVFAENSRKRVWKEHMEAIMNERIRGIEW